MEQEEEETRIVTECTAMIYGWKQDFLNCDRAREILDNLGKDNRSPRLEGLLGEAHLILGAHGDAYNHLKRAWHAGDLIAAILFAHNFGCPEARPSAEAVEAASAQEAEQPTHYRWRYNMVAYFDLPDRGTMQSLAEQGVCAAQLHLLHLADPDNRSAWHTLLVACADRNHTTSLEELAGWESRSLDEHVAEQARALGSVQALYSLAEVRLATGRERDKSEAVQLLTQAANRGHSKAELCLADCYSIGQLVPQDLVRARSLALKVASRNGFNATRAWHDAGLYAASVGDKEFGTMALHRAWERGGDYWGGRLGEALLRGLATTRDTSRGLELLKTAAKAGCSLAPYVLGSAYLDLFPFAKSEVARDAEAGVHWFLEAHHLQNGQASLELAECYLHGIGVEKDIGLADSYFQDANVRVQVHERGKYSRALFHRTEVGLASHLGTVTPPGTLDTSTASVVCPEIVSVLCVVPWARVIPYELLRLIAEYTGKMEPAE